MFNFQHKLIFILYTVTVIFFLSVYVYLTQIFKVSDDVKHILMILVFATCVFFIPLTIFISHYFTKPILEISRGAKQIAERGFVGKLYYVKKDPLGDLVESVNYMSEQVHMQIDEAALEKSRLEAVLQSMSEGVLVVDHNGNVLLINPTLTDLLHVVENPKGKKTLEIIRNINVQEIVNKTLNSQEGVYSSEVSLLFPEEKIFVVHASPIIREGMTEGVVLVFHDITELRKLERIRQEFVANVSHELRTPVASIKGYTETLLEGALYDKKHAKEFIRIINMDADRLARLIEDILDLSKIESGMLKMVLKPIKIQDVARRVLSGLTKQIMEKKLVIENELQPDIPQVLADDDRMAQVFLNLIDNAIKYTPDGGKIKISATQIKNFIHIHISDTGVGIPEEDQERIFERFYRVDKARSRELGGTGLGLSIVKHIIQAHNGDVYVKSIPGQGSTFSFTVAKTIE